MNWNKFWSDFAKIGKGVRVAALAVVICPFVLFVLVHLLPPVLGFIGFHGNPIIVDDRTIGYENPDMRKSMLFLAFAPFVAGIILFSRYKNPLAPVALGTVVEAARRTGAQIIPGVDFLESWSVPDAIKALAGFLAKVAFIEFAAILYLAFVPIRVDFWLSLYVAAALIALGLFVAAFGRTTKARRLFVNTIVLFIAGSTVAFFLGGSDPALAKAGVAWTSAVGVSKEALASAKDMFKEATAKPAPVVAPDKEEKDDLIILSSGAEPMREFEFPLSVVLPTKWFEARLGYRIVRVEWLPSGSFVFEPFDEAPITVPEVAHFKFGDRLDKRFRAKGTMVSQTFKIMVEPIR